VHTNCRYELPKIIEELRALNADIIALQEVDIACERSNNVDTGAPVTRVNLRSCRHNWTGATLGNSGH
jgi:endonuclease/exonuclease/phosphatase family metal-dependent hydrolase